MERSVHDVILLYVYSQSDNGRNYRSQFVCEFQILRNRGYYRLMSQI